MSTHPQRADAAPDAPTWRLTEALDAKLAELKGKGFEVAWIESSRADLTRLVLEGGEAALRLDSDPAIDRAWYGEVEIRHAASRELTWVFVHDPAASGEAHGHAVSPPNPPTTGG